MSALFIECDESAPITKRFGRDRSTGSTTAKDCFLRVPIAREDIILYQRQERDDEHLLGRIDCRINEP